VHGHWFYGFEHLIKGLSGGFLFFPRQGYHMHYHDIYTGLVWFGLAHDHTKAVSSTGVYLWACRFYLGVYGFGMVIANHWLGLRGVILNWIGIHCNMGWTCYDTQEQRRSWKGIRAALGWMGGWVNGPLLGGTMGERVKGRGWSVKDAVAAPDGRCRIHNSSIMK